MLAGGGFVVSSKSVVLSHPPKLAQQVVDDLSRAGVHLQAARAAKDLGLDAHADRRSTAVQQARLKKSAARATAIKQVIKTQRNANILARTGYQPQATWGHAAQGLAPTALRRLRAQVAGMSGCKYPGGCASTAIRLTYSEDMDPFIFGRLQLFKEWLFLVRAMGAQMRAVTRAWARTVATLRGAPRPWQRVMGTISAVVASLLELGWDPQSLVVWQDQRRRGLPPRHGGH